MFLIFGLGNPGSQYQNTRHNIGFLVIDYISKKYGLKEVVGKYKKSNYYKNKGNIYYIKPQTYMNLSGEAVLEWMIKKKYCAEKDKIIVIVDDYDLAFGRIKIRLSGSSGTHNGLKSLEKNIGKNYIRIRCGIHQVSEKRIDQFVMDPFSNEEIKEVENYLEYIYKALDCLVKEGIQKAMNTYNNQLYK